jgi:2-amino-4-hydroxy-6-hydroxymethyldihydropteridine diphosphokinase
MSTTAYIGFGSNLGDRQLQFDRAIQVLGSRPGTIVVGTSRLYQTKPVALVDNGPKFLNAVIAVETDLSARDLAQHMRAVEMTLGKSPSHRSDMSRSIDLDLLLYGNETVSIDGLEIPHPRMHLRGFVLVPLAELAPAARVPTFHCTVAELVESLSEEELAGVNLWTPPCGKV